MDPAPRREAVTETPQAEHREYVTSAMTNNRQDQRSQDPDVSTPELGWSPHHVTIAETPAAEHLEDIASAVANSRQYDHSQDQGLSPPDLAWSPMQAVRDQDQGIMTPIPDLDWSSRSPSTLRECATGARRPRTPNPFSDRFAVPAATNPRPQQRDRSISPTRINGRQLGGVESLVPNWSQMLPREGLAEDEDPDNVFDSSDQMEHFEGRYTMPPDTARLERHRRYRDLYHGSGSPGAGPRRRPQRWSRLVGGHVKVDSLADRWVNAPRQRREQIMEPCEDAEGPKLPSLDRVLELPSRPRVAGLPPTDGSEEETERKGGNPGRHIGYDERNHARQSPASVTSSLLERLEDSLIAGETLEQIDSQLQDSQPSLASDRAQASEDMADTALMHGNKESPEL